MKLHPALLRRVTEAGGNPVKAWVFFKDKGITSPSELDLALRDLAGTYNPRAVQRRALRANNAARGGALFDQRDLPLAQAYVQAVLQTGVRMHTTSRWLNAVSVVGTQGQLEQIALLPFVDRLEAVARSRRNHPIEVTNAGFGPFAPFPGGRGLDYGASGPQLTQINVPALHQLGFTAADVIVGILDTGFRTTHEGFTNPAHPLQVVAAYDFVKGDSNVGIEPGDPPDQHAHGTLILGCLAAYLPGVLVGGAFDAKFILCKTEDVAGEYPAEEDNYVAGLEFVEAHGGDLATASLGYIDWYTQAQLNGQTAVTTIAVNVATANGLHCCNAAGNEGHDSNPVTSHLIAPADAFQVITCGAVDSGGSIAAFSSDGPTADGRVKPELLARGVETWTVSPYYDRAYATASGTSLSTPLVACAVACLIQAHPDWSVDQMRASLFQTASYQVANHQPDPLFLRGYGIVNAAAPLLDCNHNGVPDVLDIASGTSQDCTGNGIPDECEDDCNHNGIADSCDIFAGTSTDCTSNGVPDECEPDCNANGTADSCDIASGAADCNTNGAPDTCDIAAGTSKDLNNNSRPDECEADCNGNGRPDDLDIAGAVSRDCNSDLVPDECELLADSALVHQWPDVAGERVVAQDFSDVGFPEYSTKAWDDFTIDREVRLSTGQAYFSGYYWSGFGSIRFLVEVASAPGGAEAGASVVAYTIGYGTAGTGVVTWDFGGLPLAPGTWWLSVQALGGLASTGQVFWLQASVSHPAGSEHYIHNPGNGFGRGSNPTPGSNWYGTPADLAFAQSHIASKDCNGNGVLDVCELDLTPTIQQQPADVESYAGESATLSVVASGSAPLTYQWYRNAAKVAGANAASHTITPLTAADAGEYYVVVSNACGSTQSRPATLSVRSMRPPKQPGSPVPADGATDVPVNVLFTWVPLEQGTVYKVLLGSDPGGPLEFKGTALSNRWEPGAPLKPDTTYYWRILAKNDGGTTPGPVWSFTTGGPANTANLAPQADASGASATPVTPNTEPSAETVSGQPATAADLAQRKQPAPADAGFCPTVGTAMLGLTLIGLRRTCPTARRG